MGGRNWVQGGSLDLSRRIWGISLQILSCAAPWSVPFLASPHSPYSLLHTCVLHLVLHMALEGTASACSIDLQSHFLETKFYLNTEGLVLQRSPRQSKVKSPLGNQAFCGGEGVSDFDVAPSGTHVYPKEGSVRPR